MNHQIKTLAAAAALLLAGAVQAATLSLVPSVSSINTGAAFSVDVVIGDLAAGEQLSTFDFTLGFDAAVLGFGGYTLHGQLGSLALFEALDLSGGLTGAGSVHLGELSFLEDLSYQPGTFTLATLSFTAIGAGNSTLSLGNVTLGDTFGAALPATLNGAAIHVSAVPEPSSYALLAGGLLLIGASVRRKSAK